MSTFQLDPNGVANGVPALGTTQIFTVTNSSVIGTAPTASITTSPMCPANTVTFVKVNPADKIAVIKDATVTSATLSVTELI